MDGNKTLLVVVLVVAGVGGFLYYRKQSATASDQSAAQSEMQYYQTPPVIGVQAEPSATLSTTSPTITMQGGPAILSNGQAQGLPVVN
jgi:hypothetical protein